MNDKNLQPQPQLNEAIIEYLHKCLLCRKQWYDTLKVSRCQKCGHQHIWFKGTSRLKEDAQ